jgi:hypothetical protein
MLELVKLLFDGAVLRESARIGLLTWRVWAVAIEFVALVWAIGLPAGLYYAKHPDAKWVLIAAMSARWYLRSTVTLRANSDGNAK